MGYSGVGTRSEGCGVIWNIFGNVLRSNRMEVGPGKVCRLLVTTLSKLEDPTAEGLRDDNEGLRDDRGFES